MSKNVVPFLRPGTYYTLKYGQVYELVGVTNMCSSYLRCTHVAVRSVITGQVRSFTLDQFFTDFKIVPKKALPNRSW